MKTFQTAVFALFVLLAFTLPSVTATSGVFDGTDVCRENGQRYDLATWTWSGSAWVQDYQRPGVHATITGTANQATWTANKEVRETFVVTTTGSTLVATNTATGVVSSPTPLTAIVLCSKGTSGRSSHAARSGDSGQQNEVNVAPIDTDVPEFGVYAMAAMGILGAGLIASKRS